MLLMPFMPFMPFTPLPFDIVPSAWPFAPGAGRMSRESPIPGIPRDSGHIECADGPEEDEEDLGDEEDLAVAQPAADEESSFDDFDDEFDDDFEEEENDPDWDHPDDAAPEAPPPGKGGGRKK
jgi:hypothetical protein